MYHIPPFLDKNNCILMYFSPFFTDSYDASTDGQAHRDPDKDEPSTSSARSKGATTRSRHREHNEGFLAGVAIGVASGALVLLG